MNGRVPLDHYRYQNMEKWIHRILTEHNYKSKHLPTRRIGIAISQYDPILTRNITYSDKGCGHRPPFHHFNIVTLQSTQHNEIEKCHSLVIRKLKLSVFGDIVMEH